MQYIYHQFLHSLCTFVCNMCVNVSDAVQVPFPLLLFLSLFLFFLSFLLITTTTTTFIYHHHLFGGGKKGNAENTMMETINAGLDQLKDL